MLHVIWKLELDLFLFFNVNHRNGSLILALKTYFKAEYKTNNSLKFPHQGLD